MTDEQFSALCCRYPDPKHRGNVLWKKFISDIEEGEGGFTRPVYSMWHIVELKGFRNSPLLGFKHIHFG